MIFSPSTETLNNLAQPPDEQRVLSLLAENISEELLRRFGTSRRRVRFPGVARTAEHSSQSSPPFSQGRRGTDKNRGTNFCWWFCPWVLPRVLHFRH